MAAGALLGRPDDLFVAYFGDSYDQAANSNTVTQAVQAITSTTLTDNGPNPSAVGAAVSFTVDVSATYFDGESVSIEDASNGNAVVATETLTAGTDTFKSEPERRNPQPLRGVRRRCL